MSRNINKYPLRATTGTTAEKWGVAKRSKREKRLILISGTGRSGSKTMALWFKKNKIDVLHELTGEHGASTHFFHSDSKWYPMFPWYNGRAHVGERLSDYEFEYHYHIVRNPLTSIPSIAKIFGSIDFEFLEDLSMMPIGVKNKIEKCMWAYFAINKKYEEQTSAKRRVKLEELFKIVPIIEKDTGIDLVLDNMPHSNRGSGYRRSMPITSDDLKAVNFNLYSDIKRMAKRYGYEI